MRAILDTHTLLWLVDSPNKLPINIRSLCENEDNELYVSIASFWEISIKMSIGRIDLAEDALIRLKNWCNENAVVILPISLHHCCEVQVLPFHHRDPFDRLIISQAICDDLSVISIDEYFPKYNITVIWSA